MGKETRVIPNFEDAEGAERERTPTRGHAAHSHRPRPYDDENVSGAAYIVRTGAEWRGGVAPCGRPSSTRL